MTKHVKIISIDTQFLIYNVFSNFQLQVHLSIYIYINFTRSDIELKARRSMI